jgi:hypothetical protein
MVNIGTSVGERAWLVPWDPIYTPFTLAEMLELTLARETEARARQAVSATANWSHPEDPLNRVQQYNFWDVLEASLSIRAKEEKLHHIADETLVAEFIDFVARAIDGVSESVPSSVRYPVTCAARIDAVILQIRAGSLIPDIPCLPKLSRSRRAGGEILTSLLQETLELITRTEDLLRRCHSGFDFLDKGELD